MTTPPYIKKVFSNGMKYIFIPQPHSMTTTVLILVSAGSEHEHKEINGISHFLEHLCFKGTTKRPGPSLISKELDELGAEYNAFTGNEITGYYAKAVNKNFPQIVDIMSDLYLNPLIQEDEMNRERGVIIEEINMYEDLPMKKVWEDLAFLMYGDTPAGRSIAGTKDVIQNLTKQDIVAYRNQHYVAPKTTIVVAGGLSVNPETVIAEYFSSIGEGAVIHKIKTTESQSGSPVFFRDKETDQTHLAIGVRAFGLLDERRYALSVLSNILGGSMSSRLFRIIREVMGAAYYVQSAPELHLDYGLLAISAGIDKTRLPEIVEAIMRELVLLKEKPVEEAELNKAKEHIAGKLILHLETSDEIAEFYGGEEVVTGAAKTPEETLAKIKAVTASDIMACANDIVTNDRINLSIIGAVSKEAKAKTTDIFKLS